MVAFGFFCIAGMLAKPRTISNRQFFPQRWKQPKSSSPAQNKPKIRKDVYAVYNRKNFRRRYGQNGDAFAACIADVGEDSDAAPKLRDFRCSFI